MHSRGTIDRTEQQRFMALSLGYGMEADVEPSSM